MGPSGKGFRGRNIGNGYIGWAMMKILGDKHSYDYHIPNVWESDLSDLVVNKINREYSHVVFICQDFIRVASKVLPYRRVINFINRLTVPIVPVSLGVNWFGARDDDKLIASLGEDQKEFLQVLSRESELIGVRSPIALEVLEKLGVSNGVVTGCPSYFESGPNRIVTKGQWNVDTLVTTGESFSPLYPDCYHILQDEIPWVEFLLGHRDEIREVDTRPFGAFCSDNLSAKIVRDHYKILFFSSFSNWELFYEIKKPCLTIGTRLHSAIFALNRGFPAIVTNGDARATEMCKYLGIPHMLLGQDIDKEKLFEELDLTHMNELYESRRQVFLQFLKDSGLGDFK